MDSTIEYLKEKLNLTNKNDILQYLNSEISTFLSQLDNIWDEIGIDVNEREQRGYDVIEHVKILLFDMLKEADDRKKSLATIITSLLQNLSELGKDLQIKITDDITGYECMPLLTVKKNLEDKIKKYQNIHTLKVKEVKELQSKEESLCKILGKRQKLLPISPLPTSTFIHEFKNYLHDLSEEKLKREELLYKTRDQIIAIMTELEISPSLDFEKNVLSEDISTFSLTDDNMKRLEIFHTKVERRYKETVAEVADLREKINILWERLEEDQNIRSMFLKQYPGNSVNTYRALKEEEKRCKEKMKDNIKVFIDKMRQDIVKWWERCWYSDEQKKEFLHFNSDCFTEDLLTLHEMYIDKLKQHFEKNKNIYDLICKRDELWKRLLELEERAVNPDRFKNRGGQLLREEKERNSVRTQLPKVEHQLEKLVEKYKEDNHKSFLILGEHVSDIIQNDWEQFKENRHLKVSAKKQAMENLTNCKTPLKSPGVSRMVPGGNPSSVKSTKTPRMQSVRQKLGFPLFGSSSAKKNKSLIKKSKIQVNGSIIKRASLERRKLFEKKRRSRGKVSASNASYEKFEMGLDKTAYRSTLCAEEKKNNIEPTTPSHPNIQPKSPRHLPLHLLI